MLAIWFLVPLPCLNPACTSGSSQFMYCWSLTWMILSITSLACEMSTLCGSLNILRHCPSLGLGIYMCIHIVVSPIKLGKIIRKNFIRMNLFHPNNNKCAAAVAAKSLQSCPTLDFTTTFETAGKISFFCLCVHACSGDSVVPDSLHSVDCRLPGFSILGTSQARILEWVEIPSSRGSS